jgi:hypothetical protein
MYAEGRDQKWARAPSHRAGNKHAQTSESLINMLIFVEYLDLVNRVTTKKIVVSTTGMKKP